MIGVKALRNDVQQPGQEEEKPIQGKKKAEMEAGKAENEYLDTQSQIQGLKMMILKLPGSGDKKMRGEDEKDPGERKDKEKQIIWCKEVPTSGRQESIPIWTIAGPQGKIPGFPKGTLVQLG
jgi:hypothetical protein